MFSFRMPCFRGAESTGLEKPSESGLAKPCEKDLEAQSPQTVLDGRSPCAFRCWRLLCAVVIALAVAAPALLWPRDVSWSLTGLDVIDENSLMYFVTSFGQPSSNDTLPALVFRADAALENPNFLGGRAQNGNFEVLYQGQVLGSGRSEPVAVPARGQGNVQADVKVQLDPALLKKITDDALENSLHTTVTVRGSAQVEAIFGLRLNCRMECDIRASVTEIFGENKQAVVESKSCTYKYF